MKLIDSNKNTQSSQVLTHQTTKIFIDNLKKRLGKTTNLKTTKIFPAKSIESIRESNKFKAIRKILISHSSLIKLKVLQSMLVMNRKQQTSKVTRTAL